MGKSLMYYFSIITMFTLVSSKKLTSDENRILEGKCGVPADNKQQQTVKLYGAGVKAARFGQFPWAAAIRNPVSKGAICTGALISNRHILTAAHCFVNDADDTKCKKHELNKVMIQHKRVAVLSGDVDVMEADGVWSTVATKKISIHPKYDCEIFDLALLELDKDITNERIVPICLPSENTKLAETFQVAGWGLAFHNYRHADSIYMPDELMWGTVGNKGKACGWPKKQMDVMICTKEAKLDVCAGDSGGPLMQTIKGPKGVKSYLMGVTSGTAGTCKELAEKVNDIGIVNAEQSSYGALFSDVRLSVHWICKQSGICYSL